MDSQLDGATKAVMLTASMGVFSTSGFPTTQKTLSKCVSRLALLPVTPSLALNMASNVSAKMPFIMVEPLLRIRMTVVLSVQETPLKIAEPEIECLCTELELHKSTNHLLHSKLACLKTGCTWGAFGKFTRFYFRGFQN
jgi:hypothetical protein